MSGVGRKLDKICRDRRVGQVAANEGMKIMNEHYVPKRDGFLRGSAIATPFHVKWRTPYAHRHWSGYGDGNRTTPGTRSHWEEPKRVKEHIAKAVTSFLKGL